MAFILLYVTHPSEAAARELGNRLLEEKRIACANYFPIHSGYWWQGAIQGDAEWASILKTVPEQWEALQERIASLHPYEVPCIIRIEAQANAAYEQWIRDSVRPGSAGAGKAG